MNLAEQEDWANRNLLAFNTEKYKVLQLRENNSMHQDRKRSNWKGLKRTWDDGEHQAGKEQTPCLPCAYSKLHTRPNLEGQEQYIQESHSHPLVSTGETTLGIDCGQLWEPSSTGVQRKRRGTGRGPPDRSGTMHTGPVKIGRVELGFGFTDKKLRADLTTVYNLKDSYKDATAKHFLCSAR